MRPDSQLRLLPVTQRARPADFACALLQRHLENEGQRVARQARVFLQDDLLKGVFDGVVAAVDVFRPGGAGLDFFLLDVLVDFRGDSEADLLVVFALHDKMNGLACGLGVFAAGCCDVDVALGDEGVALREAPALNDWLVCHDVSDDV